MQINENSVGGEAPCYVIAEIGINHNGEIGIAKRLIDVARDAQCQAVKLQKRTPRISTPHHQRETLRDTPWGRMTYLEYKERIEFSQEQYEELGDYASKKGLDFFASSWDLVSLATMKAIGAPAHKIASACLTDHKLLAAAAGTGKPIILSTGMSTIDEIDEAVRVLGTENLAILQSTSSYPMSHDEANLRVLQTYSERYGTVVGYSGHETGIQISLAAVAMGAKIIERHITLNRSMWGSDHAASLEPQGLSKLVRDIRVIENALGDGEKVVYDSEKASRQKLRLETSYEN